MILPQLVASVKTARSAVTKTMDWQKPNNQAIPLRPRMTIRMRTV